MMTWNNILRISDYPNVPGFSLITRQGEPAYYGIESAESKLPVTKKTIFEACSLSKPVFAMFSLILLNSVGKNEDTTIASLIGEYNGGGLLFGRYVDRVEVRSLSVRQILSHQTGFPNWGSPEGPVNLMFEPGQRFEYSGEGYMLLQSALEYYFKTDLEILVQEYLLHPLGMIDSTFVWEEGKAGSAVGHASNGNVIKKRVWNFMAPASLHTTIIDYAKFAETLLSPTGSLREIAERMYVSQIDVSLNHSTEKRHHISWCMGIGKYEAENSEYLFQWGSQFGNSSLLLIDRKRQDYLTIFTNATNMNGLRRTVVENSFPNALPIIEWLESR